MELTVKDCPSEYSGNCLAFIDGGALASQGILIGDVVEIKTRFGRRTLVKVADPLPEDNGQAVIRLDHYLRQAIKVSFGERVEVRKVKVEPLKKVLLRPMVELPKEVKELESTLQESLGSRSLPVSEGSILQAALPGILPDTPFLVVSPDPGPGIVNKDTQIEIVSRGDLEAELASVVTFEDVGGLGKEIELAKELVQVPLCSPHIYRDLGINPARGIIFHGPPGVGKTHLAKALANEINVELFTINGPDIVSTEYGYAETKLRNIFEEASHHAPSLILVDEIDVIAPKRAEAGTQATTRMVAQLLSLLDGLVNMEGVIVIGTTNRVDSVEPAMRRPGRFDREILIGPPDTTGRLEILRIHSRNMPLSDEAVPYLVEIAQRTYGFVGADLMELCREAGLNALRRGTKTVGKNEFAQALTEIAPSVLRETLITVPDVGWDDVRGLQEAKTRLRELVQMPLLYPEVFAAMKIEPPAGILLHGPPGTGKTLLARALAAECQANFIAVKGTEIFSKWLGESEEKIRHIFRIARQIRPTIIFLDQLDALVPLRGQDISSQATERVVNQLLAEMDGIEPLSGVTVVGATNRLDLLDPAILRAGRFGFQIFVPLPNEEDRRDILSYYLKDVPLHGETSMDELVAMIMAKTDGLSGAALELLCQEAKICALRSSDFKHSVPLKVEHFEEALVKVADLKHL